MQRTTTLVARLLQLPAPELAENPLDAANARIRLGKPVSSQRLLAFRTLVALLACSLVLPAIFALWSGQLSMLGVAVWAFGAIVAFVLIRHLYRASGMLDRQRWRAYDRTAVVEGDYRGHCELTVTMS